MLFNLKHGYTSKNPTEAYAIFFKDIALYYLLLGFREEKQVARAWAACRLPEDDPLSPPGAGAAAPKV